MLTGNCGFILRVAGLVFFIGLLLPQTEAQGRKRLERFQAVPNSNLVYELSFGSCKNKECAFHVRLLKGNKAIDTQALDWRGTSGTPEAEIIDAAFGFGTAPMDVRKEREWSVGEENKQISVTASVVKIAHNLNGLLVRQSAGFEHVKRRHYLFAALDNKLKRVWSKEEGAGPVWSGVVAQDSNKDRAQELFYFNGFYQPQDDEPDRFTVELYRWSGQKKQLEETSDVDAQIFGIVAGSYETIKTARETRERYTDCLASFFVLSNNEMVKDSRKYILAAFTANEDAAKNVLLKVHSCASNLNSSIVKLNTKQLSEK